MLKTFDLGSHRKARIWQEELPQATFDSIQSLSEEYRQGENDEAAKHAFNRGSFCIEYWAHLGGRTAYGLLGSTFETKKSGWLSVSVQIKDSNWQEFVTDYTDKTDSVVIGLPDIYAKTVFSTAREYLGHMEGMPSTGNLSFGCCCL